MSVLCEAFTLFYKMIFHESGDFRISHYQLAQPKAPHHIVRCELPTPELTVLVQFVPVAHHDEGCREVQPVIGTASFSDVSANLRPHVLA